MYPLIPCRKDDMPFGRPSTPAGKSTIAGNNFGNVTCIWCKSCWCIVGKQSNWTNHLVEILQLILHECVPITQHVCGRKIPGTWLRWLTSKLFRSLLSMEKRNPTIYALRTQYWLVIVDVVALSKCQVVAFRLWIRRPRWHLIMIKFPQTHLPKQPTSPRNHVNCKLSMWSLWKIPPDMAA